MKHLLEILFILLYTLNCANELWCQDSLLIKPLQSKQSIKIQNNYQDLSSMSVLDQLQGCMCDPVICNELGITVTGGIHESPNIGLGIDISPLFLRKVKLDVSYRSNFQQDYLFSSTIETKYLFPKQNIDLKIRYKLINLPNSDLENYSVMMIGPIYRLQWSSFGIIAGKDNSSSGQNLASEFFATYRVHKPLNKLPNAYTPIADIATSIGYLHERIYYRIKLDYIFKFSISVGVGYEKVYDYSDVFISLRYIRCY